MKLERICKVRINGFRGFVTEKSINVDADVVLILGANGVGKSSLMQALTVLVTGYHDGSLEDLLSCRDGKPGDSFSIGADVLGLPRPSIEIVASREKELNYYWDPDDTTSCAPCIGPEASLSRPELIAEDSKQKLSREALGDNRLLFARLISFSPEQVSTAFDELAGGETLHDVMAPVPKVITRVAEDIANVAARLEATRERLEGEYEDSSKLQESVAKCQGQFLGHWHVVTTLLCGFKRRQWERFLGGEAARLERVLGWSDEQADPELVSVVLKEAQAFLENLERLVERDATGTRADIRLELEERLRVLKAKRSRIDEALVRDHRDAVEGEFSLEKLHTVFSELQHRRDGWRARLEKLASRGVAFESVDRELEWVMPERAAARAQELGTWLKRGRVATEEQSQLDDELRKVTDTLAKYRESPELLEVTAAIRALQEARPKVEDAYGRLRRARKQLEDRDKVLSLMAQMQMQEGVLRALSESVEPKTKGDASTLQTFATVATSVLERFAMVPGVVPVDGSTGELVTASGLRHAQLSTGQKAQMLVALQVAQAMLLRANEHPAFPSSVMIFDDASVAYDVSNTTREALLWRQLAYHENDKQRWQLFIASHHEETSGHLLELLVPPAGRSMRVLKFTGWTPDSGPQIEAFTVTPSAACAEGDSVRKRLGETLKGELCRLV